MIGTTIWSNVVTCVSPINGGNNNNNIVSDKLGLNLFYYDKIINKKHLIL